MNVSWAIIKNHIATKSLIPQIVDTGSEYFVVVFDGPLRLECIVKKTDAEATELTSSFLPIANKSLAQTQQLPFASKQIGNKKLYKRVHGKVYELVNGINVLTFVIPYPWVKITGIEIVNGESLDRANLIVLDSATGMVSGTPNYPLNQFAFDLCVVKDYYEHKSEFEADLYYGLQIKMEYNSLSAKTIGLNFILNEVK